MEGDLIAGRMYNERLEFKKETTNGLNKNNMTLNKILKAKKQNKKKMMQQD